jgi:hypothetical protein
VLQLNDHSRIKGSLTALVIHGHGARGPPALPLALQLNDHSRIKGRLTALVIHGHGARGRPALPGEDPALGHVEGPAWALGGSPGRVPGEGPAVVPMRTRGGYWVGPRGGSRE